MPKLPTSLSHGILKCRLRRLGHIRDIGGIGIFGEDEGQFGSESEDPRHVRLSYYGHGIRPCTFCKMRDALRKNTVITTSSFLTSLREDGMRNDASRRGLPLILKNERTSRDPAVVQRIIGGRKTLVVRRELFTTAITYQTSHGKFIVW